ncbi:hypothetical protein GM418_28395 [Maribellus comscasis]|uniref:Porin n=1 Tax=Maribellus comscasis TaxID=2681766 RepID=A0A6I6K498_9BACT|nr:hypothetical protein [Maribellus comscasis]QGY47447.1 hypothetical protein GM418_28395 [Maribellus comscasis]
MKRIIFLLLLCLSANVYSQGFLSSKNIKVDLSGFVRNDFIFDSRRNVDACDHLLDLFPQMPEYDVNGDDINAQPSAQFLNTFTRFGTRFSGLEIGKTQIGAYVEVDFTGGASTNSLRFRHAYTQFVWPKTKLLFGRTWHPTFIEKVYPGTLNENTGLPFQVFNRSPQLRLTHQLNGHLDLIAAAVYQFKYSNTGPDGKTYQYQRDAVVPNLHAQLQYYNENWVLGTAIDWKMIQPRTSATGTSGTFKTSEKLSTMAAMAYLKYTKEKFEFKAKTMYGQNVCESLLPSGYAVASLNSTTGAETYTPFNHIYNWMNVIYGDDWKFGFFAGYLKNMGTSKNPIGPIYGFATNADIMYKLSPQLIYNYKNFMFGIEISLTTVAYGENDYNDKAKVKNTENVTNFRNMISVAYKF